MRWHTGKNTRDERGVSAVEFALTLIPLLMVIAGIVNFGLVFAQQLSLDNAVRAGARAGVVQTGNNPGTIATNQFNSTVIASTQISGFGITYPGTVGSTCENSTFGQSLVVQGQVTTKFLIPWPFPGSVVPKQVTLSSRAEFQCEYE